MFAVVFQSVTAEQDPRQLAAKRLREEHRLGKVGVYWIVPLEAKIRRGLRELKEETGTSKERLVSRLVEWFGALEDEELRAAIMASPMPESIRRLIAQRVASKMSDAAVERGVREGVSPRERATKTKRGQRR